MLIISTTCNLGYCTAIAQACEYGHCGKGGGGNSAGPKSFQSVPDYNQASSQTVTSNRCLLGDMETTNLFISCYSLLLANMLPGNPFVMVSIWNKVSLWLIYLHLFWLCISSFPFCMPWQPCCFFLIYGFCPESLGLCADKVDRSHFVPGIAAGCEDLHVQLRDEHTVLQGAPSLWSPSNLYISACAEHAITNCSD